MALVAFYRFSQRIRHKKVAEIISPDSKSSSSSDSPKKKSVHYYQLHTILISHAIHFFTSIDARFVISGKT